MLTTARPLFQHVPGAFCDPVGLASQQAPGTVSLVVAHYASTTEAPSPLGDVYDAFVAVSGGLVAVVRTTPDYRFPVLPAEALARFTQARDAGDAPHVSLFDVSEADCARFIETAFYQECLKLHVDGPLSTDLVAVQLDRSCCTDGLLELNDFSDRQAPRLSLTDLGDTPDLDALLAGVHGRVLLYDRAKNRDAFPGRTGHAFDLPAAIEQAERLAAERLATHAERLAHASTPKTPALAPPATQPADEWLPPAPDAPPGDVRADAAPPPGASALHALVAELQGRTPPSDAPSTAPDAAPPVESAPPSPPETPASPALAVQSASVPDDTPPAPASSPSTRPPLHPPAPPRHPLATELDVLRADAYALFEDAVGRERAGLHEAHVFEDTGIPCPVPAERTADYLRALLVDEPPNRWHFFKRARTRVYPAVASALLAFHAANGHRDDDASRDAIHALTQLWTRLHR